MAISEKVVQLNTIQRRTANSAVSNANLDDEEVKFLADLRGLVWAKAGKIGMSWKSLAENANLNYRTVQKFASGETRRPQIFTIRRICQAVGFVLTIKPRGKK